MATPFKMKGSPMQRNFGVGSPLLVPGKTKGGKTTLAGKWEAFKEAGKNKSGGISDAYETYKSVKKNIRQGNWKGFEKNKDK